jgi:hypothetical protein
MGVGQIEIDTLTIARRAHLLRAIADDAVKLFYDSTLGERVEQAKNDWREQVLGAIAEQDPELQQRRRDIAARLDEIREEVEGLLEEVRIDADDFELPEVPEIPEPEVDEEQQPLPLCDSRWSFYRHCARLIASKRYKRMRFRGVGVVEP